jgi:hypothetical protein
VVLVQPVGIPEFKSEEARYCNTDRDIFGNHITPQYSGTIYWFDQIASAWSSDVEIDNDSKVGE